jgi:hypothetical protein
VEAPREVSHTRWIFDPAKYPGTEYITTNTGNCFPIIRGASDEDSGSAGDGTPPVDGDTTSSGEGGGDSGNDKVFTQDQLNAIVTRETQKAARGKLDPKDLGFTSTKELKEFLEGVKTREEETKSEETKAREQAIKEAQDTARSEVLSVADERLRKAEFLVQASDHGISREARHDAYLLASTLESWKSVEVQEGGNVTGFDDSFFDELKESKPFLFKSEEIQDQGDGGRGSIGAGNRGQELEPGEEDLRQKYSALRNSR